MALQTFNSDSIGTGTRANLSTTDDLYVEAGVLLASTDGSDTVDATGSGQTLHIEGQLISDQVAVSMGSGTSTANLLYLGEASIVRSFNYSAILFNGSGTLELNGKVFADAYGVSLMGTSTADTFVTNTGTIVGNDTGLTHFSTSYVTMENTGVIRGVDGIYLGSSGGMTLINSGTIKGSLYGIENLGTGALNITNSGVIKLGASLGGQSDTYDGRLGRITGDLLAGAGEDTIKGGAYDERFEGDAGRDFISGGAGSDLFIYVDDGDSTTASAGRDLISDFSQKERDILDLSSLSSGELEFVGKQQFTDIDQVRYVTKGNTTTVFVNLDTDSAAEMSILLTGKIHLEGSDFAL